MMIIGYCRRCDDSGLIPNPDPTSDSNVKVPCPDC